ncbi:MAG: amino acid adenylation domain-containing protein, partial [Bacteroidota bacterium]
MKDLEREADKASAPLVSSESAKITYPADGIAENIVSIFEHQAAATPEDIALLFGTEEMTYRQLCERGNQVANEIRQAFQHRSGRELAPDTLIALCVERGFEMITGILGILKAGAAYVPIDPNYPQERIRYVLEDSRAAFTLTQTDLCSKQLSFLEEEEVLQIDQIADEVSTSKPDVKISPDHLSYVIYTSGTTGKPKGVMIEHRSVINHVRGFRLYFANQPVNVWLQYASMVFDASVAEIFGALLSGGTLCVAGRQEREDNELLEMLVRNQQVDLAVFPPALLATLEPSAFTTIKVLFTGGEACPTHVMRRWQKDRLMVNAYGPTEATVCATVNLIGENDTGTNIGYPVANSTTYVLDDQLQKVAAEAIGELYVAGAGLARGYLFREELTTERFVDNPFATPEDIEKGWGRMYRTGDLARQLRDGRLAFMGRVDKQVKLRGYRIELGEIEHALLGIDRIKGAVVVLHEGAAADKMLVAYYVADRSVTEPFSDDLYDQLSEKLPAYMVPSVFMSIDAIPMTINGKIDLEKLPEIGFSRESVKSAETALEKQLTKIFQEVLSLPEEAIGVNQNFFRIGGNSLRAIQLRKKLTEMDPFKNISVADIYRYNSVTKLLESRGEQSGTEYHLGRDWSTDRDHRIAIVGVSGAFSGAENIEELWKLVFNQQSGLKWYDQAECDALGLDIDQPDFVPVSGKVARTEVFDPTFWGMSPNEARLLNPQIRKFLEHSWHVLEAAGYSQSRHEQHIGVFAGSGNDRYQQYHVMGGIEDGTIDPWEATISNHKDAIATKTSFLLGLTGPANSINTACSTGLVAVVEACKNLFLGSCDMALAGAASLIFPEDVGYQYREGSILSENGQCRPFDEQAGGTVMTSGVGVVLLKRLEDAIDSGDTIMGVIEGYATNNDGNRKVGYTSPSIVGQSECVIAARSMAGVSPKDISYVECHGTGTHIGDPIEIQALREAERFQNQDLGEIRQDYQTMIGSVKANIGHSDSSSGLAGLFKVCGMLKNQLIPAQINYESPNPELQLDTSHFQVATENQSWTIGEGQRRIAGVSSFGIGGTNAHIVVGEAPGHSVLVSGRSVRCDLPKTRASRSTTMQETRIESSEINDDFGRSIHCDPPEPRASRSTTMQETNTESAAVNDAWFIPLSAKSPETLKQYQEAFKSYLESSFTGRSVRCDLPETRASRPADLADLAYTLEKRRVHFNYRMGVIASSVSELIEQLGNNPEVLNADSDRKTVFMFPGQGSQYIRMSKQLYDNEIVYRSLLDQCITIANQHTAVDVREVLFPIEEHKHLINETEWTQICLFIVEYSLMGYLQSMGVTPDACLGHSIGEYVAATWAGVFSLEDAIRVVVRRGQLMQAAERGKMLAVSANESLLKERITGTEIDIAVINAEDKVVLAGEEEALLTLKHQLETEGVASILLNTSHAFHSRSMQSAAQAFEEFLQDVTMRSPQRLFATNLGGNIAGDEVAKPKYWSHQLSQTVRFSEGVEAVSQYFNHKVNFIEVGPGKGLSSFVQTFSRAGKHQNMGTLALLVKPKGEKVDVVGLHNHASSGLSLKAALWSVGLMDAVEPDDSFLAARLVPDLPGYQFEQKRCWIERKPKSAVAAKEELLLPEKEWLNTTVWSQFGRLRPRDETHFKNAIIFLREDQVLTELIGLAEQSTLVKLDVIADHLKASKLKGVPCFTINPHKKEHFTSLADQFDGQSIVFDAVIHAASINSVTPHDLALNYSFDTIQFIQDYFLIGSTVEHFLVLTSGIAEITGSEPIHTVNGLLPGLLKHVDASLSHLKTTLVDVGEAPEDTLSLTNHLLATELHSEAFIPMAIRSGRLWKQQTDRIDILEDDRLTLGSGERIGVLGDASDLAVFHELRAIIDVEFVFVSWDEFRVSGNQFDSKFAGVILLNQWGRFIDFETSRSAIRSYFSDIENLLNSLAQSPPQFIAFLSSLSSFVGTEESALTNAMGSYFDLLAADQSNGKASRMVSLVVPSQDSGVDYSSKKMVELLWSAIGQDQYDQVIISPVKLEEAGNLPAVTSQEDQAEESLVVEDDVSLEESFAASVIAEVLGLDQISVHDDFFRLGGNSLLAIQVAHRINEKLSLDIKVADFFQHPSVSELITNASSIELSKIPVLEGQVAPLSFSQERLWFIELYEQGTDAYHMPLIFELVKGTKLSVFKQAIQAVVTRHEVLRTVFRKGDNAQWEQVVQNEPLTITEKVCDDETYQRLLQQEIARPFDLEVEYPLRVCCYEVAEFQKTYALVMFHHIASDGWSVELFGKELYEYCRAFSAGQEDFQLAPLPIQYRDYGVWQRKQLTGVFLKQQLTYWRDYLNGVESLALPTDFQRPSHQQFDGGLHAFSISEGVSKQLRILARQEGVSLYSVLLASVSIYLSKISGQEDVVTGSPHANRGHYQTSDLIGFFVNTVVNRVRLKPDQLFSQLIKEVHQDQIASQEYQYLPFEQLLEVLEVDRDPSRHPLFQVMFSVQGFGHQKMGEIAEFAIPQDTSALQVEKFDLSVFMDDADECVKVQFSYAKSLFNEQSIRRMAHQYITLLDHLILDQSVPYSKAGLLNAEEQQLLIETLNDTAGYAATDKSVISLFEKQVTETPDCIAIVFEDQELTYQELNDKANQVANRLLTEFESVTGKTMQQETLIALCLGRSAEMVIGILAVLKAGGAYLAIDPQAPQDRINFMFEDSRVELLLTQRDISNNLESSVNTNWL